MEKYKWKDKQCALSALGYFDMFDKVQLETVYRLAILRQYNPLETIYNEDRGLLTYVHFVVSGECMILQCLRMKVISKTDRSRIFQLEIIKKDEDDIFHKIDEANLMTITTNKICALQFKNNQFHTQDLEKSNSKTKKNKSQEMYRGEKKLDHKIISNNKTIGKFYTNELIMEFEKKDDRELDVTFETSSVKTEFSGFSNPDMKIENRFIDVGSLTFGGIFGLGEHHEHRVIMARTTVQCILIPRFWFFEKKNNPGGIWDRRRFYIECNIPSRQQIFENFLTTRKWQKYKNALIERNLGNSLKNNPTKIEDIPIICRIVESIDD